MHAYSAQTLLICDLQCLSCPRQNQGRRASSDVRQKFPPQLAADILFRHRHAALRSAALAFSTASRTRCCIRLPISATVSLTTDRSSSWITRAFALRQTLRNADRLEFQPWGSFLRFYATCIFIQIPRNLTYIILYVTSLYVSVKQIKVFSANRHCIFRNYRVPYSRICLL